MAAAGDTALGPLEMHDVTMRAAPFVQVAPEATELGGTSGQWSARETTTCRRTSLLQAGGASVCHGHRIPGSQYFALVVWMFLLLAEYGVVRAVCSLGVPHDCKYQDDAVKLLADFQQLFLSGFLLAIYTGMHWPDRFQYIFHFRRPFPRGLLFLVLYTVGGAAWGMLDLIPALQTFSLTGINPMHAVPLLCTAAGAIFLVSWHVYTAYKHNSRSGFVAYVLSRFVLAVFYGAYLVAKFANNELVFHFHHYVVGFLAASLAEFNHPFSLILLAIGTGVFVQGIAAYDADAILDHPQYYLTFRGRSGEILKSPWLSKEAADFFMVHCSLHANMTT